MPELSLPDVNLHYEVSGTGPPLLLIAGMLSDNASWGALLPLLAGSFTVIRPDNRGTGRTAPWDAEASVQTHAEDAAALMNALGHARYHLVGHSMGGLAGMELAGMFPDRVRSLSILASAPVRAPRTMAIFDALRNIRQAPDGERLWLAALLPWVFRPGFFTEPSNSAQAVEASLAYPYAQTADAMARQIEVLRSYRASVKLQDIRTPTLVLHAADDILIPMQAARAAFAAMPDVTQIVVPDAGHSIHWDAPGLVAEHLSRFIAAHPTGAEP
jgi:pimeloyl-ACP methyl ester carboxylesterase